MRLKYLTNLFFSVSLSVALFGCAANVWNRHPPPQVRAKNGALIGGVSGALVGGIAAGSLAGAGVGAVAGGILGASLASIFQSHMTLVKKLQYNGVHVIQLGDEIELILPANRFFKPNSALMNIQYYPVLTMVADFIKQFPSVSVKVAGYTNDQGVYDRNLALSTSWAQSIMRYLWNSGIDKRLIYAVGYGSQDPIANNHTYAGLELNNRIQITLRKIRNYDDI